jgi:hypothetical protein
LRLIIWIDSQCDVGRISVRDTLTMWQRQFKSPA